MYDFLEIMIRPLVACLILTGIHAYVGLHVIKRGVLFVDLALAQVAALGATIGFLFGFSLHSQQSYLLSLFCTFFGALILSMLRAQELRVTLEAWIGVVYALAAAGVILVLSKSPEGGEELKSLMVGHLLFAEWSEIIKIFIIYSIVGVLFWFARKPLLAISNNPEEARKSGLSLWKWDLFFYGSFGIIVTSSTELAGVLLVFCYLTVPAICGVLLSENSRSRLLIGWLIGVLGSLVGISASYFMDLPTGATVVVSLGALLVCILLISLVRTSTDSKAQ